MANWFILDVNKKITNIISAETKEIAEMVTGLTAIEVDGSVGGGIGYIWDENHSKFKPEFPPHVGWIFDEELWRYEAPIPYPTDGNLYTWDDQALTWKLAN